MQKLQALKQLGFSNGEKKIDDEHTLKHTALNGFEVVVHKTGQEDLTVKVGAINDKGVKEKLLMIAEEFQELLDEPEPVTESTFEEELDEYESTENQEFNKMEAEKERETVKAEIEEPENTKHGNGLLETIKHYVGNDVLEVFGDTGSGKSKFVLEVAREALAEGKKVYYLDTERNLTRDDISSLKGCQYKYTPVMNEIDKIAQDLPKVDVVIIDSIGFPVLTTFARMSVKQKGDALLKLIAIFGDLKTWAYKNNGVVIVTNQPESDFNKDKGHVIRPFGDKSQFAAKEIWKTEFVSRKPDCTKTKINAFRSRSAGHGTRIANMEINSSGVFIT